MLTFIKFLASQKCINQSMIVSVIWQGVFVAGNLKSRT